MTNHQAYVTRRRRRPARAARRVQVAAGVSGRASPARGPLTVIIVPRRDAMMIREIAPAGLRLAYTAARPPPVRPWHHRTVTAGLGYRDRDSLTPPDRLRIQGPSGAGSEFSQRGLGE